MLRWIWLGLLTGSCAAQTLTGTFRGTLNGVANPSSYGVPSNGDATATSGAIVAGAKTLTLQSAASFAVSQGVMVGHAGAPCGTVRGQVCPVGPVPPVAAAGGGSAQYSYRIACLDELGGVGAAGAAGVVSGSATLSATNANVLTIPGVAGCIEAAVYRNGALIGLRYAPAAGSYSFRDEGQAAVTSGRDVPLTPPAAALNDNLVALIAALNGGMATLNAAAGATIANAQVWHSDTPLLQAAIDAGGNFKGDANYRVNYPLRGVNGGGIWEFSALCDTGTICLDATGQYNLTLTNVSLNKYGTLTAGSDVGLFCARNAKRPYSQYLNTNNLFVDLGAVLTGSGMGSVAFYNYGCEIENHIGPNLNADQLAVLTSNNQWNVQSPFDATEVTGSQSMSQVVFEQATGGTATGAFYTFENAYSIQVFGGYNLGGNSAAYPWAFEMYGQNGDIRVIGYRTEQRGGFAHIHAGGALVYATIDYGLYRAGATTAAIQFDDGASASQVNFRADDYGGSPTMQAIYACATSNCGFVNSEVQTGYWQSFDPAHGPTTLVHAVRDGSLRYGAAAVGTPGAASFTGTKTVGGCSISVVGGVVTAVTGC